MRTIRKKGMKYIVTAVGMLLGLMLAFGSWETSYDVQASETVSGNDKRKTVDRSSSYVITDDDRAEADAQLKFHMDSILKRTQPDEYTLQKLNDTFYSAIYYIANTDMSVSELWSYVSQMKGKLDEIVPDVSVTKPTTEFLQVGDNWETPSVRYGQPVSIVLPIINMGTEELTDLIVQPVVSNLVAEWPFEPEATGYSQTITEVPANPYSNYDMAMFARREVTYAFTAREDVMTGYYPLKFQVWYTKAGVRCEEPVELTVYVYAQGKPGSSRLGGDEGAVESKPRIVVTGFETDPEEIYAGDTFMVTIHVKNMSSDTAVNNVLFDMQAVESGSEANTTYAVFLPTSGSSSVYTSQISAGQSFDINIEMTAKTDLVQKPYVITVKMKYDAGKDIDLTEEAKVSVPVLQKARFDSSSVEVTPGSVSVGNQSNVMFSIYNTGKTTLYNVQVKYEGASVEGGDTFIGNVKSGETGNVDSMLTGIAPTMDDGTVKAIVSYEDESGKAFTFEKEFQLAVIEEMPMDPMMPEDMPEEDTQGGIDGKTIGIAAGAAAALAAAVAVIVIRKKKKKEKARKLEEDFLDLKLEKEADEESGSSKSGQTETGKEKSGGENTQSVAKSGDSDGKDKEE